MENFDEFVANTKVQILWFSLGRVVESQWRDDVWWRKSTSQVTLKGGVAGSNVMIKGMKFSPKKFFRSSGGPANASVTVQARRGFESHAAQASLSLQDEERG